MSNYDKILEAKKLQMKKKPNIKTNIDRTVNTISIITKANSYVSPDVLVLEDIALSLSYIADLMEWGIRNDHRKEDTESDCKNDDM